MQYYIARRLLLFIPTMVILSLLVFLFLRIIPGDPAELVLGGGVGGAGSVSEEDLENVRKAWGTDKPIEEIADQEGKHPIDALLDIVVADNLGTELYAPSGRHNAEYVGEIANSPYSIPGASDGGAHVKFSPGGVYSTDLLTWLVRDEGTVTLEEAHYKLSYLPAFIGGLKDRGFLREGAPADIIVYDLDQLAMRPVEVAHDLPDGDWRRVQRADGYRWILVNGQMSIEDGIPTGVLSGKLLRHGRE